MPLESGGGATGELSTTLLQEPRAETVPAAFTPLFFLLLWWFFSSPASNRSSSSLVGAERVRAEQLGILEQPQISTIWKKESDFSREEETLHCPGGVAGERNQTQLASLPFVLFTRLRDCSCLQARFPGVLLPILQNAPAASSAPWAGNFKGQVSKMSCWGSSVEPNGSGCSPEKRPVLARRGLRSDALMDGFSIL